MSENNNSNNNVRSNNVRPNQRRRRIAIRRRRRNLNRRNRRIRGRRFQRFNIIRRRNNNPKNKINNSNNNSVAINKVNNRLDAITKKLSELSLDLFPKVTNIQRSKKEPRTDIPLSPIDMALSSRFVSIFKTSNRIRYMSVYTRHDVPTSTTQNRHLIWFPYAVNFESYPDLEITIGDTQGGQVSPNMICNLVTLTRLPDTEAAAALGVYQPSSCGLVGMYRVIGATLKMTNTTPYLNRGGSYTIYKLNEKTAYPAFINSALKPNLGNAPYYADIINRLTWANHDQVLIKQAFSGSDVGYIHEYNTYEGNNIFGDAEEYLGQNYVGSENEPVALWPGNPTGNNIKYQIDIPKTGSANTYLCETWQVIEVVPDPSLNLDNLSQLQTHVFPEEIINKFRAMCPISKSPKVQ